MKLISADEVSQKLETVPGWSLKLSSIFREFTFRDFEDAMKFVNLVAGIAERAGHHPDINIRYNKVMLCLSSHDAGGLTDSDFSVAKQIDSVS